MKNFSGSHEGRGVNYGIEMRSAEFALYNDVHKFCCRSSIACVRLFVWRMFVCEQDTPKRLSDTPKALIMICPGELYNIV